MAEGQDAERSDKPVRRNIELHPQTVARLDKLRTGTEATSDSEVIRTSIQINEVCFDARQRGARVVIEEPDGTKTQFPRMLLP